MLCVLGHKLRLISMIYFKNWLVARKRSHFWWLTYLGKNRHEKKMKYLLVSLSRNTYT